MMQPDPTFHEDTVIDLRASRVRVRRTLLCSDIVGYTALLSRVGDVVALHIVRRHDGIVRQCAAARRGEVVELRGDSFLVSFVKREDALACAIDIQRALAADRAEHADGGVHVRIGVHTGALFLDRGRLFGLEVVVPFRLLDHTDGDEILASGDPHDASSLDARALELKGIAGRVRAVPVAWSGADHEQRADDGTVAARGLSHSRPWFIRNARL
jgi:class 3 adenylate cyclase